MKIGLQIFNFTFSNGAAGFADDIKEIVTKAEESGFYSVWVMDHFFQLPMIGPAENDMHEGYSMLSYIAGLTSKIKLGTMVTGNIYRNPGVLIKTVTTLDVISKGRAYFGIGTGWFEREALGLGIPFYGDKFSTRFEMLEETLQIAKQMWSDNNGEYNGKHYQLKETICSPQPLQKPYPPILIGGMGENKTLRMVAQYADACNFITFQGMDRVKKAISDLKGHCEKIGRSYDEIEKTVLSNVQNLNTAQDTVKHLKALAEIGIDHTIFGMGNPLDVFNSDIFAEVKDL